MAPGTLADALRDSARPVFLFGMFPPREGTTVEKAKESCAKFAARSAVLATDGFLVYDIQDEAVRTTFERPFPLKKCMDAAQYASFFPAACGKECVVYKSVVEAGIKEFDEWLDAACDQYHHSAFNLVGAPSSKVQYKGLKLHEAGRKMQSKANCSFGCVCIPERHTSKGNEDINMLRKSEFGAEWFITQGIFSPAPVSRLLNEYGDACRQRGLTPKKVVLTFAPCGRPKTMAFIKWLGMYVPEEKEKRILTAQVPVRESVKLLQEILLNILEQTSACGVPIGINVESLSIYKDEIDAAHDLFQLLQATLLNNRGSPWSVRWYPVVEARLLPLKELNDDESNEDSLSRDAIRNRNEASDSKERDISLHLATVGFVGILGIIIGKYSHKM